MKALTCAAARRSLQAFHDRELPVGQQIAVWAHLDWCGECAAALSELQLVGAALRGASQGRGALGREEAAGFNAAVVSRLTAEQDASWLSYLRGVFEGMHVADAGMGAAAAMLALVLVMLGMMRFATIERPDPLAAIVEFLATPGSNQHPLPVDERVLLPRALGPVFGQFRENDKSAELDTVFTLAAVVTKEGRIANLELLHGTDGLPVVPADEAKLVEGLLDAVSRAQFEPARMAGLPVAVNMVWLVARTTVHANKNAPNDVPAGPGGKKRAAALTSGRTNFGTV